MTEQCNTCLGCQAQEGENFKEKYHCPNYVDGREPEPEQMEMEESTYGSKKQGTKI
jgi:hypothetical protein